MNFNNIEDINNKDDLITYYLENYRNDLKKDFCELILTKIGKEDFNSPVKLSSKQKNNIINIINDDLKMENQKFEECLSILSFDQINYIGW